MPRTTRLAAAPTTPAPTGSQVRSAVAPDPLDGSGLLPVIPQTFFETPSYAVARIAAHISLKKDWICAFEGEHGTGKTTAAAKLAQASGRSFVYVECAKNATIPDLTAALYEAVTGEPVTRYSKQRDMRRDIIRALVRDRMGIIADDVHITGVPGMQVLRYLHDEVVRYRRTTNSGFPLWLVGGDVLAAITPVRELRSRVRSAARFESVNSAELIAAVRLMSPRIASLDDALLARLMAVARGNLRDWSTIVETADLLWPGDAPLTEAHIDQLLLTNPAAA